MTIIFSMNSLVRDFLARENYLKFKIFILLIIQVYNSIHLYLLALRLVSPNTKCDITHPT